MDRNDDRTVLVDHSPKDQTANLTAAQGPRFEQLEERMVYAARLQPEDKLNLGISPVIDAAAAIFAFVAVIRSRDSEDTSRLKAQLIDEIKAFEFNALNLGVDNNQIAIGRYLLCSFIDEAVVTTAWGSESNWSQHSMLSTFHNETYGGEKFFQLLERLSRNPAKYLHLLELMYICLSLGFEGKYRVLPRGLLELESIRDSLYRQIRMLRGEEPRALSPNWAPKRLQRHKLTQNAPMLGIAAVVFISLSAIFGGFPHLTVFL